MKPSTSFTKQQEILRCPRRFYFRYIDQTAQAKSLCQLLSVRELGGHCVHDTLAKMVRAIADGGNISDQVSKAGDALKSFDDVVSRSLAISPRVLHGEMQLAESHNGIECEQDIRDWREIIPIAMENGFRFFDYFGLRSESAGYTLKSEQRVVSSYRGRPRRFVLDVLIDDKAKGVIVIDWKVHSITDVDLKQLDYYQAYLLDSGLAKPTRIFGFAVDLLHETFVEHHHRKFERITTTARRYVSRTVIPASSSGGSGNPYPAKPSLGACGICPYASICSSSAIAIPEVSCVP